MIEISKLFKKTITRLLAYNSEEIFLIFTLNLKCTLHKPLRMPSLFSLLEETKVHSSFHSYKINIICKSNMTKYHVWPKKALFIIIAGIKLPTGVWWCNPFSQKTCYRPGDMIYYWINPRQTSGEELWNSTTFSIDSEVYAHQAL